MKAIQQEILNCEVWESSKKMRKHSNFKDVYIENEEFPMKGYRGL